MRWRVLGGVWVVVYLLVSLSTLSGHSFGFASEPLGQAMVISAVLLDIAVTVWCVRRAWLRAEQVQDEAGYIVAVCTISFGVLLLGIPSMMAVSVMSR